MRDKFLEALETLAAREVEGLKDQAGKFILSSVETSIALFDRKYGSNFDKLFDKED